MASPEAEEGGGGVTPRSMIHALKSQIWIKKFGNKILKKMLDKTYIEVKILLPKPYNTINQCDTIFSLLVLLK